MHEHNQRAVARDVVGNRGPVVPLQGFGARHPVTTDVPSCQGALDRVADLRVVRMVREDAGHPPALVPLERPYRQRLVPRGCERTWSVAATSFRRRLTIATRANPACRPPPTGALAELVPSGTFLDGELVNLAGGPRIVHGANVHEPNVHWISHTPVHVESIAEADVLARVKVDICHLADVVRTRRSYVGCSPKQVTVNDQKMSRREDI